MFQWNKTFHRAWALGRSVAILPNRPGPQPLSRRRKKTEGPGRGEKRRASSGASPLPFCGCGWVNTGRASGAAKGAKQSVAHTTPHRCWWLFLPLPLACVLLGARACVSAAWCACVRARARTSRAHGGASVCHGAQMQVCTCRGGPRPPCERARRFRGGHGFSSCCRR